MQINILFEKEFIDKLEKFADENHFKSRANFLEYTLLKYKDEIESITFDHKTKIVACNIDSRLKERYQRVAKKNNTTLSKLIKDLLEREINNKNK